jgi:tRNA-Thr(GGU) m(6)t(6)A37 methyltransferase TsaA
LTSVTFEPIGVVRSPFFEKKDAPRQPAASLAEGCVVLRSGRGLEDALEGIASWSHVWIVYVFDRAGGYRPKVQPPRAHSKKGVLATRSPHRPNPIGLSVVRLLGVRGLELDVAGIDMLDGTPVLDIKPYVSYTDVVDGASAGWLADDPVAPYSVTFGPAAQAALELLLTHGVALQGPIAQALSLGPEPHAYRRIRREGEGGVLSIKDWRARFVVAATRAIEVLEIRSGYTDRQLLERAGDLSLGAHHALSRR